MVYGIPNVGYFSASDNSGINRYTEALLLQGDAFKELEYWLSVFNRAQQFGLPNTSIAEISSQIFRVSQKLTSLRQLVIPTAQNILQNDNQTNQQIPQLFQQQQQG